MLAPLFLLAVGLSVQFAQLPATVAAYYLLLTAITFAVFGLDKWAAKRGSWRTSEKTLQSLSLVGGWPGGLMAQHVFRHKTSKRSFQQLFWVTVVLNCVMFLWLFTVQGKTTWQAILAELLK